MIVDVSITSGETERLRKNEWPVWSVVSEDRENSSRSAGSLP